MAAERRRRAPIAHQVAVPTHSGVRVLTVLEPATLDRYVSLVASAAPAIEARLTAAVLANRVTLASPEPPLLRLEPTARARGRFVALARRLCRAPFVVVADVEDCFPSIAPDVVDRALVWAGVGRDTVAGIQTLLHELIAVGVSGLPVGPVPSAVVANAVLARVDDELARAGRRHVRWVDDVWVAARSRTEAEDVCEMLDGALARLGLRLSRRKTRIAASADVSTSGVSRGGSEYHRAADAHPLPGVPRPDAVAPRRG